ncbi:hypothetical protein CHS0354_037516 [Potamilus streckersoni]|uniref:Trafficking kinesin-binding protein 1 n=1 Tax=Potamilus streckersoni TaxID=2493646 RepID=A0AAE0RPE9_9BIVA|nr:hypothetical protein CHS0354_037516 [Potamilus streckersoni]
MDGTTPMFLCAERVTQMTKTYNDIEAVTRLLEEKERDLELAARIGQTLLDKNRELEIKCEALEEQFNLAQETLKQLRHELSMKDELLKYYANDYDSGNTESPEDEPYAPSRQDVSGLQKRVRTLEEENLSLRCETSQLQSETSDLEEKEQLLVQDCVKQLEESHQHLQQFAKELSDKTEECHHQKEEITNLLSQVVDLQKRIKLVTIENVELQKTLDASRDSQRKLTAELLELKNKNEELLELLEENQEELRRLRSKQKPGVVRQSYMSSMLLHVPSDSLASELESSLRSEAEENGSYSTRERRRRNWKVFETARAAKKAMHSVSPGVSSLQVPGSSNQSMLGLDDLGSQTTSVRSSMYLSDGGEESVHSDGYNADLDSLYGSTQHLGRPGIPGSNDLETALRRLSMRRANELNELDFQKEMEKKMRERCDSEETHGRCKTPDSMISGGSGWSYFSMTGSSGHHYKMPEKLQIIKPLEGSVTLRQWQQLATPHIGRIFEERPGVQIKGERKLDLEEEVYSISDLEEDDDYSDYALRKFPESPSIYTYTNSTVKHPSERASSDDEDSSAETLQSEETDVVSMSSTPRMSSNIHDDHGTRTYSMSLGLASILNERDLISPPSTQTDIFPKCLPSNPCRFPCLVTETVFSSSRSEISSIMTNSTDTCKVSPSHTSSSSGTPTSVKTPTADTTAEKFLDKLKNKSFSLYGYLASGVAGATSGVAGALTPKMESPKVDASCIALTNLGSKKASDVSIATGASAEPQVQASGLVTAVSSSSAERPRNLASVGQKAAGSVLGALSAFKRNGIL